MTLTAAAEQLGWDKARLSRLENGKQNQTVEDVSAILFMYGVTDDDARERMFEAVRSVDEPGWWEKTAGMTKESAALADYEHEAEELVSWAPLLIPGLLQTMDYAAAFMEAAFGMSTEDIGIRLGARRERQRSLGSKRYTAYLGESALRSIIGDRRIMAAQLRSLTGRTDVTIRVVPTSAPTHLGQLGPFLLLRLRMAVTIVNVELLRSATFQDDPDLTAPYEQAVTQIAAVALGETESAHLIELIRKEMEG